MELTKEEQRELALTKKLVESLVLHGAVYNTCGFIHTKNGDRIMSLSEMKIAVDCLNRINFKLDEKNVVRVERVDNGGLPTWNFCFKK